MNKSGTRTKILKHITFTFISLIMFGLTTTVSLVNNPHLDAHGHHEHVEKHSHLLTNTMDHVVSVHPKTFNIFQQYHSHGHSYTNTGLPFGTTEEDEQYQNVILAKLRGEEAKAVLGELDKGVGIFFSAYIDENNNPVVELHRDVGQKIPTVTTTTTTATES